MAITWNEENATHLLRRVGFSATPKEVTRATKKGLDKTLAKLLKPPKRVSFRLSKKIDDLRKLQAWWVLRMVKARNPLLEKITLFWHNHFATAYSKIGDAGMMHRHVMTLQLHGLGNFRDLLLAVSQDPAMLIWLDNVSNFAGNPNENYARELMELFSTGVFDENGQPNYTETDVAEVARAFTGWTLDEDDEFAFDAQRHDFGTKTVKGVTGDLDGGDVVDLLASDPATARRMACKLWSFFAYPVELDDPICDELATTWTLHDGDVAAFLDAVFRHDQFYSAEAKGARIKSPVEFVVGTLQAIGARIRGGYPYDIGLVLENMGQSIFDPPDVFGWDEGLGWVSLSGLLYRTHVADWIAEARDKKDDAISFKPDRLLGHKGKAKSFGASEVVAAALDAFGVDDAAASTVAALEQYVAADKHGNPQPVVVDKDFYDLKVRGLIALICASPEYQTA